MTHFFSFHFRILLLITIGILYGCSNDPTPKSIFEFLSPDTPEIKGKPDYLPSLMVTAGNKLYMVGHQDGSFPPLGWHITGEMGGIWDHPIKLMDGFETSLVEISTNEEINLDKASIFFNYPMSNKHIYELDQSKLKVERIQFVPDDKEGMIVQFRLHNLTDEERTFQFNFTGRVDLRPTWLGERTGMIDAIDEAKYNPDLKSWVCNDLDNPWFAVFGSDQNPIQNSILETKNDGKGLSPTLNYHILLPKNGNKTITFALAGSHKSKITAHNTFNNVLSNWEEDFIRKSKRYQELAERSKLITPDKQLNKTFEWLKYNCDWLIRDIPELGTAIGAGIPDYPWLFGVDSEYALKGYVSIGQLDIVYKTIAMLDSVSHAVNGNGRIIHEMSTNGAVFNPGNINETPQFASLIRYVYDWTGNKAFLEKYFSTIQKGLEWLIAENDDNKNLFPDGFGMMEIHGMDSEMIDVAAYTQKAFSDAAYLAKELGKNQLFEDYNDLANKLKIAINDHFWSEEFNSYADFIGTDEQAVRLIDDAIVRADTLGKPWAINELKMTKESILYNPSRKPRPWVVHHNWVVNTPMEMGLADPEKAIKALTTAEKFVNPFGVFVTGIDRDETAGSDEGSFQGSKAFSYTGAVMTLPTGVLAVAENNYGRPDRALDYLNRMVRSFSYALPGSMYEVSPDYGMMVQAWNIYAFAIPIVQQFFGIYPDAINKLVKFNPQMPTSWDAASIDNVVIGDNAVSVEYSIQNDSIRYSVSQRNSEWTIKASLSKEMGNIRVISGKTTSNPNDEKTIYSNKTIEFIVPR